VHAKLRFAGARLQPQSLSTTNTVKFWPGTPRPYQRTAASPYRLLDVRQKIGRDCRESGRGHIVSMLLKPPIGSLMIRTLDRMFRPTILSARGEDAGNRQFAAHNR